jgi:hypothetical protein
MRSGHSFETQGLPGWREQLLCEGVRLSIDFRVGVVRFELLRDQRIGQPQPSLHLSGQAGSKREGRIGHASHEGHLGWWAQRQQSERGGDCCCCCWHQGANQNEATSSDGTLLQGRISVALTGGCYHPGMWLELNYSRIMGTDHQHHVGCL